MKSEMFNRVRAFILAHSNVNSPAHDLSVKLGDFTLTLNQRQRGLGYITIDWQGICIASECPLHSIDGSAIDRAIAQSEEVDDDDAAEWWTDYEADDARRKAAFNARVEEAAARIGGRI